MKLLRPVDRNVLVVGLALSLVLVVEIYLNNSPIIVIIDALPGQDTDQPITTTIRIGFSQPMNITSVEEKFSIVPPVEGKFSWDGNVLVFNPSEPLLEGATYEFRLADGARTRLGVPTQGLPSITFVTRRQGILFLSAATSTQSLMYTSIEGDVRTVYTSLGGIDSFSVSPDGSRIVLSVLGAGRSADLWIVERDGANPTRITDCGEIYCGNPEWSPDGSTIAYEKHAVTDVTEGTSARIWLLRVFDLSTQPLFEDPGRSGFDAKWSTDSDTLAYYDPDIHLISVVRISTGDHVALPSQLGQTGEFSPDGQYMAYADLQQVGFQFYPEIWIGSLTEPSALVRLDANAQEDQFPAWSPDGKSIAFGRRRIDRQLGLATQLAIYDVKTREIRVITEDANLNSTAFRWDRTGEELVMLRFRLGATDTDPELWLYNRITGELKKIVATGLDAQWIP